MKYGSELDVGNLAYKQPFFIKLASIVADEWVNKMWRATSAIILAFINGCFSSRLRVWEQACLVLEENKFKLKGFICLNSRLEEFSL